MPLGYMYEIYDETKKEKLPGIFQSKEVREMLEIKGSISEQVKAGTLFKNRYRVKIVGEWPQEADTFAEEWDKARMRLLRGR